MRYLCAAGSAVSTVTAHICCVSGSDGGISERTGARATLVLSRSASPPPTASLLLQIAFELTAQMSRDSDEPCVILRKRSMSPWVPPYSVVRPEVLRGMAGNDYVTQMKFMF